MSTQLLNESALGKKKLTNKGAESHGAGRFRRVATFPVVTLFAQSLTFQFYQFPTTILLYQLYFPLLAILVRALK